MRFSGEDGLWGCRAQKGFEGQSSGDMQNHVKQVPFSPAALGGRQLCVSETGNEMEHIISGAFYLRELFSLNATFMQRL